MLSEGAALERLDVGGGDGDGVLPGVAVDEQGRQQAGPPRQGDRGAAAARSQPTSRAAERALQRVRRGRAPDRRRRSLRRGSIALALDPDRAGRHGVALVGELQGHRAVARDQQVGRPAGVEGGERGFVGGLDGEEAGAVDPRPASRAEARRSRGRRRARRSNREFRDERDVVRRPGPVAAGLVDDVAHGLAGDVGRRPHMVEAAAAVVPGPVGRAVAPPGVEALGRRDGNGGRGRPSRCCAGAGSAPRPRPGCG